MRIELRPQLSVRLSLPCREESRFGFGYEDVKSPVRTAGGVDVDSSGDDCDVDLDDTSDSDASLVHDDDDWISVSDSDESGGDGSSEDSRYEVFFNLLRGAALGEPLVCEDVAVRAIRAGSLVEFSPDEVERHLQRAVEELRIMRSRGNVYFV